MRVSINWLSVVTGKHAATVKKRVSEIPRDAKGKMDSASALEAIYYGVNGSNGEFITTAEAVRQLTIAKKEQIELQNAQARHEVYPADDVRLLYKHAFAIVTATLKGNENRLLSFETVNDILRQFREAFERFFESWKAEEVAGANGEKAMEE